MRGAVEGSLTWGFGRVEMDPDMRVDCEWLRRSGREVGRRPAVHVLGGVGSVTGELEAFFCEEAL